jgi:hypothetical protein
MNFLIFESLCHVIMCYISSSNINQSIYWINNNHVLIRILIYI